MLIDLYNAHLKFDFVFFGWFAIGLRNLKLKAGVGLTQGWIWITIGLEPYLRIF